MNHDNFNSISKADSNGFHSNLLVDEEEIEIQFDILAQHKISSEISIAYNEVIQLFKSSEMTPEDLSDVLESY